VEPCALEGFVVGVTADRRRHEQAELFEQQGARVMLGSAMTPSTMSWALADDLRPAYRLIEAAAARRLDAVTFTYAPAVVRLFALAGSMELRRALVSAFAAGTVAASLGAECTARLRDEGLDHIVEPAQKSLGALVGVVADELGKRRTTLCLADIDVSVQGSLVRVGADAVVLSDRERAVLDLLCERSGTVVSRSSLLWRVWSTRDLNAHVVDVTVGRLRRRLGPAGSAIRTIARRGYLLDVTPATPPPFRRPSSVAVAAPPP